MSNYSASVIQRAMQAGESQKKKRPASRVPSRRDQEIFQRVVVNCERQCAIASELGLTRGRVSQIIGRVRRWLAQGSQGGPHALAQQERKRLERSLAQARQEAIYQHCMREVARQSQNPKHTTIRTETKPDNDSATPDSPLPIPSQIPSKIVTTVRDQPLNVQLLKAAQRSAIELQKLAELEPIPEPQAAMPDELELYESLYSVLSAWRRRAEDEGRVAKSRDACSLVDQFLSALVGRPQNIGLCPDAALRELVRRLVMGALPYETYAGEKQLIADVQCNEPSSEIPLTPEEDAPDDELNIAKHEPAETTSNSTNKAPPPPDATPSPLAASANDTQPPPTPKTAASATQKTKKFSPPPPGMFMFGPYTPPAPDDPISIATHPWTRPF